MTELSGETASTAAEADTTLAAASDANAAETAETADAQRPGVPVWRVGKPDAFLAADVAKAREAVASIAGPGEIGVHVGARSEGVRCVTHLFESKKPGYRGWAWFATLSRISRGKESTVNEVGLLPTEDSVLAPAWVPWSERVRPEDREEAAAQALGESPDGQHHGDTHEEDDSHSTNDAEPQSAAAGTSDSDEAEH